MEIEKKKKFKKKKRSIYTCVLINKISKKKKKKSIHACLLINKISLKKKKKVFFMYIDKQNQLKKSTFFSILACNTSNTKWLIYSLSQHLTRLANDFPVFLLNRSKLPMCSYYFFLF